MTVEDRLRATTEAVAAATRPLRPLELRPVPAGARAPARRRPARPLPRWRDWLIPFAAATAVIAAAATLVAVRGLSLAGPGPGSAPASSASASVAVPSSGVPRYYVDLGPVARSGVVKQSAILGDTSTGRQLAAFSPPPNTTFSYTAAAADNATFVLFAASAFAPGTSQAKRSPATWYVLRLPPGAPERARLTRIPIAAPPAGTSVIGLAVSPDGRTLAGLFQVVTYVKSKGQDIYRLMVRTYSLATGQALRTWSDPAATLSPSGPGTFNVSWLSDGRTLAFAAATRAAPEGIRFLNTAGPGSSLVAGSRLAFSRPAGDACSTSLLTPDGTAVICGGNAPDKGSCAREQLDMTAYSVATGKPERVLYRYRGSCQPGGTVQVMWAGSGTLAIGAVFTGLVKENRVGLMTAGTFIPLRIPSNGDDYGAGSVAFSPAR